jgi:hypothetical protein
MQVKSKQRVADHGEVFTSEREVNSMLDLVKHETERIDSKFLEPACGTGNFLAPILERKLDVVERKYKKSQLEFERYSIIAVSSIYGIDIQQDNVIACRKRLLEIFYKYYKRIYKDKSDSKVLESAGFILSKNIIWGDALEFTKGKEGKELIVFSEWSAVNGSLIKRRDFIFEHLVVSITGSLFSDLGDDAYRPTPTKEFPPTHFLELQNMSNAEARTQ